MLIIIYRSYTKSGHSIDFFSLFDPRSWASFSWGGLVWYLVSICMVSYILISYTPLRYVRNVARKVKKFVNIYTVINVLYDSWRFAFLTYHRYISQYCSLSERHGYNNLRRHPTWADRQHPGGGGERQHRTIVMVQQQTYIADAVVDSEAKTETDVPSQQHVERWRHRLSLSARLPAHHSLPNSDGLSWKCRGFVSIRYRYPIQLMTHCRSCLLVTVKPSAELR